MFVGTARVTRGEVLYVVSATYRIVTGGGTATVLITGMVKICLLHRYRAENKTT